MAKQMKGSWYKWSVADELNEVQVGRWAERNDMSLGQLVLTDKIVCDV